MIPAKPSSILYRAENFQSWTKSRNDPGNKDMAIRRFFGRFFWRFLSFSQWCFLPPSAPVQLTGWQPTTEDVSCIFCCFQYGLAFREPRMSWLITIVSPLRFFSRSISLFHHISEDVKMGTNCQHSVNPTSFRLSKSNHYFPGPISNCCQVFSREKKWMLSSFLPWKSLHVPPSQG